MIGLTEQVQRLRADEFGKELFTIPAFELLLDLYTRRSVQPRSLTSLPGASSASERHSQRTVHRLAERGFLALHRHPYDARRIIGEPRTEPGGMPHRLLATTVGMAPATPLQ